MSLAGDTVHYTWDDYQSWPDDARWEIIGGEAFAMSPAPTLRHQSIVGALAAALQTFFEGRNCAPFVSPIDVRFSEEDTVQPDLVVVCDAKQLKETHIEGPPTLVVEILSPSSLAHDRVRKMHLYERFGIQEYWIVTPNPAVIEVFLLDGETYRVNNTYMKNQALRSPIFPELSIRLEQIFTLPLSDEEKIDEIRECPDPYKYKRKVHQ